MAFPEGPEDSAVPAAQTVRPGSLLVSSTDLVEPTFRRTVVYVIEHNDAGSLGVVLNRPSETALRDVLPRWSEIVSKPKAIYIGGPVKEDAAICLGVLRSGMNAEDVAGVRRVEGRTVMIDLDTDPDLLAPYLADVRVFAGYAGWTVGQLDGELARSDWMVFSSLPSDVVVPPRVDLWSRVLRRQAMPLAMLATHPIDLERN
ncbi:YqgE/AlgH family protein [Rhodococcus sp. D2-41]|uniref:UPF0301 protein NVS88_08295 n=1 Tax=Speluncibacter jeojiensis TaxID=2710754 RepID=A0A9X4RDW0_9ACTN|nr:YqgE/AlgH family protein [Rhodococcus sp. D2-41]MDG3009806.1 YqgE/AlgH family protein [Rhodococcus sp. D2-41]MDG3014557.1 YqgE/AlgH family protein [Corynebacteriales bacterium D3-21]